EKLAAREGRGPAPLEDAEHFQVQREVHRRDFAEAHEAADFPVLDGELPAVRVGVAQAFAQELDDAQLMELGELFAHFVAREAVEFGAAARAVAALRHEEVVGFSAREAADFELEGLVEDEALAADERGEE